MIEIWSIIPTSLPLATASTSTSSSIQSSNNPTDDETGNDLVYHQSDLMEPTILYTSNYRLLCIYST